MPQEKSKDTYWYPPMRVWNEINADRPRFVYYLRQGWNDDLEALTLSIPLTSPDRHIRVSLDNPNEVSDEMFKTFIMRVVQAVHFSRLDGEWDIMLNEPYRRIFNTVLEYEEQDKLLDHYEQIESG